MSEFQYNGVEISIGEDGQFSADVGGTVITKPTLKALKNYIKDHLSTSFKPFTGLLSAEQLNRISARVDEPFEVIHIIGFSRTTNRRHRTHVFRTTEYPEGKAYWQPTFDEVYKDTPQQRAILTQIKTLEDEKEAAETRYRDRIDKLREKLKTVSVKDFVTEI